MTGTEAMLMLFVFATIVVGLWLMYYFRQGARVRRALAKEPTIEIASATPGQRIKIAGTVRAAAALGRAPFSGRDVVAYDVDATYHSYGGGNVGPAGATWITDFIVEDETGEVLVRAAGAHLGMPDGDMAKVCLPEAPEFALELLSPNVANIRNRTDAHVSTRESRLSPGERAAVLGVLTREEGRLVLAASGESELFIGRVEDA